MSTNITVSGNSFNTNPIINYIYFIDIQYFTVKFINKSNH